MLSAEYPVWNPPLTSGWNDCGPGPRSGPGPQSRRDVVGDHSHSMVPGGFEVTSSTTRFTSGTWLVILFEMRASTS